MVRALTPTGAEHGRALESVYLDAIVKYLREQGYPVRDEDVARLSPLGWRHINLQGRYAFISSPPSELRPLRDPIPPTPTTSSELLYGGDRLADVRGFSRRLSSRCRIPGRRRVDPR
ncbi:Tn3 family transposase [Saccharopolyspora griseoalba]|uniref:Tn3 family transposase n=1 Tax=Saccharopolyspora griseoalba TaxID=1431848 RepID=A0ABW2LIF4_9PSEU